MRCARLTQFVKEATIVVNANVGVSLLLFFTFVACLLNALVVATIAVVDAIAFVVGARARAIVACRSDRIDGQASFALFFRFLLIRCFFDLIGIRMDALARQCETIERRCVLGHARATLRRVRRLVVGLGERARTASRAPRLAHRISPNRC